MTCVARMSTLDAQPCSYLHVSYPGQTAHAEQTGEGLVQAVWMTRDRHVRRGALAAGGPPDVCRMQVVLWWGSMVSWNAGGVFTLHARHSRTWWGI